MTHKNDFIRVFTSCFGPIDLKVEDLGLSWPPPEFIVFAGWAHKSPIREATPEDARWLVMARATLSELTEEQVNDHIARVATYKYVENENEHYC